MGEPWILTGVEHRISDEDGAHVLLRFHSPNYKEPFYVRVPEDRMVDKFRPELQEILQPAEGEPVFE